jgi:hypothetical protein
MKTSQTSETIDERFEDLIRNKMTDKQFNEWLLSWLDIDEAIETALNWDTEDKEDTLKDWEKKVK